MKEAIELDGETVGPEVNVRIKQAMQDIFNEWATVRLLVLNGNINEDDRRARCVTAYGTCIFLQEVLGERYELGEYSEGFTILVADQYRAMLRAHFGTCGTPFDNPATGLTYNEETIFAKCHLNKARVAFVTAIRDGSAFD